MKFYGLSCSRAAQILIAAAPTLFLLTIHPASADQKPAQTASSASTVTASGNATIGVADFSGADKELGRFLADTLLTDLAQSPRLHLVERSEIRQALTELKLQSTGLTEPSQIKKIGKILGADSLIVGSYLIRDNQLILNARLLDVRTGRVTPGGAANVTGACDAMLPLVNRLAHLFHRRVTGEEIILEGEELPVSLRQARSSGSPGGTHNPNDPDTTSAGSFSSDPPAPDAANAPSERSTTGVVGNSQNSPSEYSVRQKEDGDSAVGQIVPAAASYSAPLWNGIPSGFSPNAAVTSGQVARATRQVGRGNGLPFFTPARPTAPISRLDALVALVRATVPSSPVTGTYRRSALAALLPDAESVPVWALGFVTTAIKNGLWTAHRPLRPHEQATWAFIDTVASHVSRSRKAFSGKTAPRSAPSSALANAVARARHDMGETTRTTPLASLVASHTNRSDRETDAETASDPSLYTGLLVDAHDLKVQRTMSPRILDEAGNIVYPDQKHLPDFDYLEDNGMADYVHGGEAKRAGTHPLVVQALSTHGDDFIVSSLTADHIRAENARSSFFSFWRVCFLIDEPVTKGMK